MSMQYPNPFTDTTHPVRSPSATLLHTTAMNMGYVSVNHLALRERTEASAELVASMLSPRQKGEVEKIKYGKSKSTTITTLPFDGTEETAATYALGALGMIGARPFAYAGEGNGEVMRLVAPKKGKEDELNTAGTRAFDTHVDHAWLPFPFERKATGTKAPDFLVLVCVSNSSLVGTEICDPEEVVKRLPEKTQKALKKPDFSFLAPTSLEKPMVSPKRPVLMTDQNGLPALRISPRMVCETAGAEKALQCLKATLESDFVWKEVVLEPGQVLLMDAKTLHRRGAIPPGSDRKLVAVYGRFQTSISTPLAMYQWHLEKIDGMS